MSEVEFELIRLWVTPPYREKRTRGSVAGMLVGPGLTKASPVDRELYTVECPWLNNQRNESCIPEGRYLIAAHNSPRFPHTYVLENVPDRDAILIHGGNSVRDVEGCVAVGHDLLFQTDRGWPFPTLSSSQVALNRVRRVWDAIIARGDRVALNVRVARMTPGGA